MSRLAQIPRTCGTRVRSERRTCQPARPLAEHGGSAAVVFCRGLAREVDATIKIGTCSSFRTARRRRKWLHGSRVRPPARAAGPLDPRPPPAPGRGNQQPAQLVDRMPLEVGFQLSARARRPPAAALESRQIGLQRRAHGRGLADAGFHESSRRSVGCLCHHGKMLRTDQRPSSSRANSPAGPVRKELKDSPEWPGPRAGHGATARPRRWARATAGSYRGRER